MAVGDTMPFACRTVTHTALIAKATMATVTVSSVVGESPGEPAVAGGPEKVLLQKQRIDVQVFGGDPSALRAVVGAVAANLVIAHKGDAGANEKETIKNVYFHSFTGPFEVRDPDTGGPVSTWGVAGTAEWAAADTLAVMWINATDA